MSKALFAQRRDGRVAALQFLYAWSMNPPKNLTDDLFVFFSNCEQPREHYGFGEELIHGVIELPQDSYGGNPVPEPATVVGGLAFAAIAGARFLRRRK